MITVPQAFFDSPHIDVLFRKGQNCVIEKVASEVNPNNERYLASHAITIVHQGQLLVQTPDGEKFTLQRGQMILIPRGIYMISDIIPEPDPFQATVFFFEEELVDEFLEQRVGPEGMTEGRPGTCSVFPFHGVYKLYLENLKALRLAYGHREATRIKLLEFLHLVAGSEEGETFIQLLAGLRHRRKQSVKSFMEQNFSLPLKIEDYAYLTGRSISSFHRDFKRQFGVGPKSWLVERRLTRAHDRLRESQGLSVTQLAYESGYDNVSYFIKAFQRQYGISPKQLQIQQREKATV